MTPIRLIVDPPQCGDWNMAVDEALLHAAAAGTATLRFYEWSVPTLSLGYFQQYHDRQQHSASQSCPCVRRSSGGGAILHDRELTYSFTAPIAGQKVSSSESVYWLFHESLIRVLAQRSIDARLNTAARPVGEGSLPFLCFQRHTPGDVLLAGAKICGSAQRRHRGALLQHGSVLMGRSTVAPELPGIEELSGRRITASELTAAWCGELCAALGKVEMERGTFDDCALAEQIRRERFASRFWLTRR